MDSNKNLLPIDSVLDGRFRVLAYIGKAGGSHIYKAQHQLTGRTVALKVLHWGLVDSQASLVRFQNEARGIAALNHPNLVTALDFGLTPDSQPYLVTEFLAGKSLADLIRQCGSIEPGRAIGIFRQLCAGLTYMHQKNLIHGDLNPENVILVSASGDGEQVKIVSAGTASLDLWQEPVEQNLTRTGELIGSMIYSSPEYCAHRPLDSRSDVYQLGCIMYEMLAGKVPPALEQLLDAAPGQARSKAQSINASRSGSRISKELNSIVLKALAKEPKQRYQSIEELDADLTLTPECKAVDGGAGRINRFRFAGGKLGQFASAALLLAAVSGAFVWYSSTSGQILFSQCALGLQERFLPEDLSFSSAELNHLCELYRADGRYKDAIDVLRRLILTYERQQKQIEINESRDKLKPPEMQMARERLASLYLEAGIEDRDAALIADEFGGNYERLAESEAQRNISPASSATKAAAYYKLALSAYKRERNPQVSNIARLTNSLANCEYMAGKLDDSQRYYAEAIQLAEKSPESVGFYRRNAYVARGRELDLLKRFSEADSMYERAITLMRKESGPRCVELIGLLQFQAGAEFSAGKKTEAQEHCREAIRLYCDSISHEDPTRMRSFRESVAACLDLLQKMGCDAEAEQLGKSLGNKWR